MRIGIFSKLGSSGGSEHRTVEMANAIVRYSPHECWVFCEGSLNNYLKTNLLNERVELVENVFEPEPNETVVGLMYDMDSLLIVNTDSDSFSKLDYWEGRKEKHHSYLVDVSRFKQMVFLYNFVFKVSKNLPEIRSKCPDVRIITANDEWSRRIDEDDNYSGIRSYPRMVLRSLIDPDSIDTEKMPSPLVRIGKHSKPHGYKFNPEHAELIRRVNDKYGDFISWDFMGVPSEQAKELESISNVTVRKAFSMPVKDYLRGIDLFLFFIKWERYEPWSRCVAEGMMSGCPILAPKKGGNMDQVHHEENGYLFSDFGEAEEQLCRLISNRDLRQRMGECSRSLSQEFTSEKIIRQYLDFISVSTPPIGVTSIIKDVEEFDTLAFSEPLEPAVQESTSTEVIKKGMPECIVIFSLWRSGSSWLEDMLGKKVEGSKLFGHEQQLFPFFAMMQQAYFHSSPSDRKEANKPVDEINNDDFHRNFGLKFAKVLHNMKKYSKSQFLNLASGLLRVLLSQYGQYEQVVEKSLESIVPQSFNIAYQLLGGESGFRLVFLFRDFKPYLASCYEKFVKKGKHDFEYYTHRWIEWNLHALDVISAHKVDNLYVLEYDDMVANPSIISRFALKYKESPHVRPGTLDKWKICEKAAEIESIYEQNQQAVDAILDKCRRMKIK